MGIWQAPDHPLIVEYSTQVLEELRAAAEEGFQKIPHGGIEIGALLLGEREPGTVRILEWRPIECEHAKGPGFVLSAKDVTTFDALMGACRQAPELRSLEPVGWFHTHTRSKIFLSPDDLAIHNRFFPDAGQVALVMRLAKDQPTSAGFFVRNAAGEMHGEASPLEFAVNPDPTALIGPVRLTAARRTASSRREPRPARPADPPVAPPPQASRETPPPRSPEPAAEPEPHFQAPFVPPEPPPAPWRRAGIVLAGASALAVAAWIAIASIPSAPATAGLRLEETEGQLEIRWDHGSRPVSAAESGVVSIQDGPSKRTVELTGDDVRRGTVFYTRTAEDLRVRLELYRGGDLILQEMARFVGQGVPQRDSGAPARPEDIREEMDRLEKEVAGEVKRGDDLRKQIREAEEKSRRDSPIR